MVILVQRVTVRESSGISREWIIPATGRQTLNFPPLYLREEKLTKNFMVCDDSFSLLATRENTTCLRGNAVCFYSETRAQGEPGMRPGEGTRRLHRYGDADPFHLSKRDVEPFQDPLSGIQGHQLIWRSINLRNFRYRGKHP